MNKLQLIIILAISLLTFAALQHWGFEAVNNWGSKHTGIGETLDTLSKAYGPTYVKNGDFFVWTVDKLGDTIWASFDSEGHCDEKMYFSVEPFTIEGCFNLIKDNYGPGDWIDRQMGDNHLWVDRKDSSRNALYTSGEGKYMLLIGKHGNS